MAIKSKEYRRYVWGEKMNQKLRETLDEYYKTIKENRPNYRTCYNSFIEYCDKYYSQYSLRELFETHLDIVDIRKACKYYIEMSQATSIVAVQRFLTAMDYFYRFLKNDGIRCECLEAGCRRKEIVHDICTSLGNELEQKIYLPFDDEQELKIVNEQLTFLNRQNFYQLGQSIIYRLLITYGFKEKVVINFKRPDFDSKNGKLLVNYNEDNSIYVNLSDDIYQDLKVYCALNKYEDRVYLFTKSNGTALTADSMLSTLKSRLKKMDITNFTPTTVALYGVTHLIEKGLNLAEIKFLTGFETQKIEDVSQYLLTDENIDQVVNEKLCEGDRL